MTRTAGGLPVDEIAGESDKYTCPLVILHGLWSCPSDWRPAMGYLAHLGWRCLAPDLRPAWRQRRSPWARVRQAVTELLASMPAPPVLVGHDAGALLVLELRRHVPAAAVVAPLLPPPVGGTGVRLLQPLSRRWWRRQVRAPRAWRPSGGGTESVALLRELVDLRAAWPAGDAPLLVITGAEDRACTPAEARTLAQQCGASLVEVPGSHDLPIGPAWRTGVSALHRWVIQTLGESLLALLDEDSPPL